MDLIDRQAVIDKIKEQQRKLIYCFGFENDMVKIMDIAKSLVISIPSAQPERKNGKWLEIHTYPDTLQGHTYGTCSSCLKVRIVDNFCPNCGAEMEIEDGLDR